MLDKLRISNTFTTGIKQGRSFVTIYLYEFYYFLSFFKQLFNCIGYRPVAFKVWEWWISETLKGRDRYPIPL